MKYLPAVCVLLFCSMPSFGSPDSTITKQSAITGDSSQTIISASNPVAVDTTAKIKTDSTSEIVVSDSSSHPKDTVSKKPTSDSAHILIAKDTTQNHINDSLLKSANQLDKSVVVGKSEGQADAYNKQRNSDNLKNIVDAELIQKLPDQSTADALQRVPGVSIERSQGEGRYVQIRGTESRLSTVTINGQSIASPDAQTRAVALNVIPADQLAEIEVSKVLTPDMDGDAIGGTVNLVTSAAKDKHLKLKATLTPGYTHLSNTPIWQGSASISKCFLPDAKLGVLFGGSYYRDDRETHGVELTWDTSVYIPSGQRGGYLYNMQYRDYNKANQRLGLNGRLDYRFTKESNIFLVGSYNNYGIHELRRTLGMDMQDQDARPMSNADVVGDVPTTRSIKDRVKDQKIISTTLGGKVKIAKLELDGNLSYSYANTNEPDEMTVTFERTAGLSYHFDHSNSDRPVFEPIRINDYKFGLLGTGKEVFNYDSSFDTAMNLFKFGSAKVENTFSEENSFSGQFNAKIPFDLNFGGFELKAGAKALDHTKRQTIAVTAISDTGPKFATGGLDKFLDSYSNDHFYNDLYKMNNMPDIARFRNYIDTPNIKDANNRLVLDATSSHMSIDPETFTARDFNGAGYLMGTLKTDLWKLIAGARMEYTSMHYSGFTDSVNSSNNWVSTEKVEVYRKFIYPLPMVISKFSPAKNMNLRLSYTRSFSRPNWFDLVPHTVYNVDDNVHTATKGNPDLRPTTSNNFDLSGEYFFNNKKSILSAGAFFKRMHDYVFSAEIDTYFNQSKTAWTYYTKGNGDHANVAGVELEFQSQLFFIPGFFGGFGMSGNYIYTYSNTVVPGSTENTALPGQSKHVGNVAVFFEKYGFNGRVALNYQSKCIVELASSKNNFGNTYNCNTYIDDHAQLDCSISQKIPIKKTSLTVVVEMNNLTNAPKKLYLGDVKHTTQMEYYGWTGQLGLRFEF